MNYDLLKRARKILQPLWEKSWMRGNCWGPKSEKNPYGANNIILCKGDELVSVSQRGEKLAVHEFQKTADTKLGKEVKELLRRGTLIGEVKERLSFRGYTARCKLCHWTEEFDPNLAGEVDSRGEYSHDFARRIYEAHERHSPGCDPVSVEVLDQNMVKQEGLAHLVALSRAG